MTRRYDDTALRRASDELTNARRRYRRYMKARRRAAHDGFYYSSQS